MYEHVIDEMTNKFNKHVSLPAKHPSASYMLHHIDIKSKKELV